MHAWWTAYVVIVVICASMMRSFSELDMPLLYRAMGHTEAQIALLADLRLLNPAMLTFVTCLWRIMTCIYLVWVRDCFMPEQRMEAVKSFRQRKAEEGALRPAQPIGIRTRLED